MSWRYNRHTDRMVGHDFPGVGGNGLDWFVRDELELGARVALRLGEADQAWWALHDLAATRQVVVINGSPLLIQNGTPVAWYENWIKVAGRRAAGQSESSRADRVPPG